MSGYGTPCSGELQFWAVVQSQLRELVKQVKRVADALEAREARDGSGVRPEAPQEEQP